MLTATRSPFRTPAVLNPAAALRISDQRSAPTGLLVLCVLLLSAAAAYAQGTITPKIAAPAPAAGTMFLYPERIPLADGGLALADRGVIFVPTHRAKPGSAVISLEVYRFRAARPQSTTPPIFLLYGGPSFEGLEPLLARKGYYEKRIRPLTDAADVVVVSQRGIGPSKPTTLIVVPPPFPLDHPATEAERVERVRANAKREKAFWVGQGLDLDGFTILEKMRSDPKLRDIPVVVVSGGDLTAEQQQQLRDFGQRMIKKGSLTEKELLDTLERALKRVQA